ncbi:hypothetical protein ACFVZH_02205 [Streptomyces sp. NPDC059534]|uniref:hypothetical protein n=1 Tax=Streptomyces sp. NPDC059534 TaxID=3346859 RepID=UPI00367ED1C8
MSSTTGFRKRAAAVLGATALIVAGGVATALPASAGPNCPSGYHCVFSASIANNNKHAFFNSDADFTNDYFDVYNRVVNDEVHAASNSSDSGYESHYYRDINYGGGLLFCVNPGSSVDSWQLTDDAVDGDGRSQGGEASSLKVRSTTSVPCF